nr:protein translocase subunit SecF [Streptomyces sp. DSM 41633]
YSSIFIATPLVADLKERDPQMKALKKRVLAKRAAAEARGDSPEDGGPARPQDRAGEGAETAGAAVGRPRQPRGHGRTPGKR